MKELERKGFKMMTRRQRIWGWFQLSLWGVLIMAGIVAKRVYDAPDWVMPFHFPAAVFLVLAFRNLSTEYRARYQESLKRAALRMIRPQL
jgi:hypothetical protein